MDRARFSFLFSPFGGLAWLLVDGWFDYPFCVFCFFFLHSFEFGGRFSWTIPYNRLSFFTGWRFWGGADPTLLTVTERIFYCVRGTRKGASEELGSVKESVLSVKLEVTDGEDSVRFGCIFTIYRPRYRFRTRGWAVAEEVWLAGNMLDHAAGAGVVKAYHGTNGSSRSTIH